MTLLQTSIVLAWALCAAGFACYVATIAQEITYVTLADGRRAERKIPLLMRLLLPLTPNFSRLVAGEGFAAQRREAGRMLVAAGMEGLLSPAEFLSLKLLMPICCGGVWILLMVLLNAFAPGDPGQKVILGVLGIAWFYFCPVFWLRATLKRRHAEITRALPFVLDLLTLSVEAGMDFMSALQRCCERRRLDALNEEFVRMTREIQVGTPRRVALQNMAERVRLPDLKSFVHALVQADELGVSIGSILRIQSEQLRGRRFDRAEKLANEAPVKMLGPLLLCIFPAVFIILLAPILLQAAGNMM